jgi:hypothetical protein
LASVVGVSGEQGKPVGSPVCGSLRDGELANGPLRDALMELLQVVELGIVGSPIGL